MILGYIYISKFFKVSVFYLLFLLMFKLKFYFVICVFVEIFVGVNVVCKMCKE